MSGILSTLHQQAKQAPKRIILPEHYDPRVISAATTLATNGLATPILISAPDNAELTPPINYVTENTNN